MDSVTVVKKTLGDPIMTMRNWLKPSPPAFSIKFEKTSNKNDMAAHAIFFYYYYCQQPSTMAALPAKAIADTRPCWDRWS